MSKEDILNKLLIKLSFFIFKNVNGYFIVKHPDYNEKKVLDI